MKARNKQTMKVFRLISLVIASVMLLVNTAYTASYEVRGKTMSQVRSIYGEPSSVKGPIGGYNSKRPPITQWDYGSFYITFEGDIALHGNDRDSLKIQLN